ncbi:protein kinase domain-containing protein [Streptomyces sp. 4N509B]|uniref:protein kinase domain-containing protein n=1 Tax=Streptomyces sp. 4N509B TaxID=3457413 RepID=UPI003FD33B23
MEPLRAGDPERVGAFVLRGRLGAGGMGEVFLGRSPGGLAVAVKVVYPHLAGQREFRRRFGREVEAARAVSGAFTAPVVAAGPGEDPPWIATVYVPGPDLAEAVAVAGPLPEAAVWALTARLVEALQAIHAADLLHRDLKPSNVLLAADGPRVIDFGIARTLEGTALTGTGQVVGTPGFMSPEQVEGGELGPASDVFALGAVVTFAATGTEPFGEGPPLAVLHRVVSGEPRLDALRGPLRELAAACLARNPDDRPTLPQLLDRITSHWQPPDDFPVTSPWPAAVTTLIHHGTTPPTAPYTEAAGPVPPHAAPTETAPPRREEHAGHDEEAGDEGGDAGQSADSGPAPEPDDRDTLAARREHACELGRAGETEEAVGLLAALVADHTRALGPDDRATLLVRLDHAMHVGEAGRYDEAARLLSALVADCARVLGPDDRDTLSARFCHAGAVLQAGEIAEGARLLSALVVDCAGALGPDDPTTLEIRRMMVGLRSLSHGRAAMVTEYEELLADLVRVLGPDDPRTLDVRTDLVEMDEWQGETDHRVRAVATVDALLTDCLRVLGPDDPRVLRLRALLAHRRLVAGDPAGAEAAQEHAVAEHLRVLGPDHPDTLRARRRLVDVRSERVELETGKADPGRFVGEYERLLADHVRALGPDHPDTLDLRGDLVSLRGEAGDRAGAVAAQRELLADMSRLRGPNDLHVLAARVSLADLLGRAGDLAGAVAAYEELLPDGLRLWGADFLGTLVVRASLADVRGRAGGEVAATTAAFEEVLADCLRLLDPTASLTRAVRAYLDGLREHASDPTRSHPDLYTLYEAEERAARRAPGDRPRASA